MKKSTTDWAIVAVVSIPALYVLVAAIEFRFRHPWMTGTEMLIATPHILTFGTCVYSEWRPR